MDWVKQNLKIVKNNLSLFVGFGLLTYGLFSFEASKFCEREGSSRRIFDCIDPTTYYYYSDQGLSLIIIGVLFVTFWYVKNRKK